MSVSGCVTSGFNCAALGDDPFWNLTAMYKDGLRVPKEDLSDQTDTEKKAIRSNQRLEKLGCNPL